MTHGELKAFCRRLPGTEEVRYGEPSNVLCYFAGGKRFAHFKTSAPERWRFSLKVTPERFLELTDIPGVRPARYFARHHWVTIVRVEAFPAAYLKELVVAALMRSPIGLLGAFPQETDQIS